MTFARTRDPALVERIVERDGYGAVDLSAWLANDLNVAIEAGDDLALFQWEGGDTYSTHWLFASRGGQALTVGEDMLASIFDLFGAQAVWGMIPVENRKSRLFTRWLGCVSLGIVDRPQGAGELFFMGREQWASSAI